MGSLILYGEHCAMLDNANRLAVPTEIRELCDPIGQRPIFFLIFGANQRPWLYPQQTFERIAAQPAEPSAREADAAAQAIRIECDAVGRVRLPDDVCQRANFGREVTLIGVRDHLEIWPNADWLDYRAALLSRLR
jgi:division/cell wall cluster transcriptional repressor MraZ